MAKRDYIELDKTEIPVIFDLDIDEDSFTVGINYNERNDFFTIDLWDSDGNVIVLGEKLMLNIPLFSDLTDDRLPAPTIIPMDESGEAKRITYNNFYETVFLYFDDIVDEEFDVINSGDTYG